MIPEENQILNEAFNEEKNYNWLRAIKLYQQLITKYLEKNNFERVANLYKKLGYLFDKASEKTDSREKYIEMQNHAIDAFQKANKMFLKLKNTGESIECNAESLFIKGLLADSEHSGKKILSKACDLFLDAHKEYSNENNKEKIASTLSRAAMTISFILYLHRDPKELDELSQQGLKLAKKAWEISFDLKDYKIISDSLIAEARIVFMISCIKNYRMDPFWDKYMKEKTKRCEMSLEYSKECEDKRNLSQLYFAVGFCYGMYGLFFLEDETHQNEFIEKQIELLEKCIELERQSFYFSAIIETILVLDWLVFLGGKIDYIQKRIFNDLKEIIEHGKKFSNSFTNWQFYTSFLPAMIYGNFALSKFFKLSERKSYAEKGIKIASDAIKTIVFEPFSAWLCQMLTLSHCELALLSKNKTEKEKHAQTALEYAKKAETIADKYEGGWVKNAGSASLYKAYKTLAEIVEPIDKKVNMLSSAIDSIKKYMQSNIESRTGILTTQLKLGLLYEEFSILTKEISFLSEAKTTLQEVINQSIERGYDFCAAAAHEYIARIEDRLGNHSDSANHYKEAEELHRKSLEKIEFKPLKIKIKEKIDYAHAWGLIETAKSLHKKEMHIKAKEFYNKASNILKNLSSYAFEGTYYAAWALQEEAEELSKQEKQEEAIQVYRKTIEKFQAARSDFEKILKISKYNFDKERIEKLNKVANLRKNYCSARIDIEKARILGKKGEHLGAAEKFASAANQFRSVCDVFKLQRERQELKAVYYLCKAWENMELAEKYEDPVRFSEAAHLFNEASSIFTQNKLKLLSLGNASFCQALEYGCNYDNTTDTQIKAEMYQKVKLMLRKAAESYQKGGFLRGAEWALATSTYFDASWHLIKADLELDIHKRREYLSISFEYLKSAASLFNKAGYHQKENEIFDRLKIVEKEEHIIISALNAIKKPSISGSTEGIIAPACPIESSSSTRLSEVRQFTSEAIKVSSKKKELKPLAICSDGVNEVSQATKIISKVSDIKVFLSYATLDSKYFQISKIASGLKVYPKITEVLFWEEDLHDDIYDYMDQNLGRCDIFLLFCSPNSIESEPVQMEWKSALKIKKKIVPIFYNEEHIPNLLTTKLGLQFNRKNIDKVIEDLYNLILKKLEIKEYS